jgi:hypothetical protein
MDHNMAMATGVRRRIRGLVPMTLARDPLPASSRGQRRFGAVTGSPPPAMDARRRADDASR